MFYLYYLVLFTAKSCINSVGGCFFFYSEVVMIICIGNNLKRKKKDRSNYFFNHLNGYHCCYYWSALLWPPGAAKPRADAACLAVVTCGRCGDDATSSRRATTFAGERSESHRKVSHRGDGGVMGCDWIDGIDGMDD